jgi:diguanylate cyclase (GGDEF)-like protein
MKRAFYVATLVWLVLIGLSFYWNYANLKAEQKRVALEAASSFFKQIVITRAWNAEHGGVYVPVTKATRPNPYLIDELRDIAVNKKMALTKVNPAFMTRQIAEIAEKGNGIKFHITSLNPIRPANKPTPKEAAALKNLEQGIPYVSEFYTSGQADYFFYMAPLWTTKECLACHAEQGYKEGDIRGGISVTLPFVPEIPAVVLALAHLFIGLVGGFGITYAGTRLDKAYGIIQHQAVMDALTGIPNRRSFTETLLKEFGRSQRSQTPLSLVMCDIDHFKGYNDSYGHTEGDKCLIRVAKIIETELKRPSDYCARYGGEEFVIILPDTPANGAIHIAEKIRLALEKEAIPHKASPPLNVVTLSLGVSTMVKDGEFSHEDLIKQADQALYAAKQNGRNQVYAYAACVLI